MASAAFLWMAALHGLQNEPALFLNAGTPTVSFLHFEHLYILYPKKGRQCRPVKVKNIGL